MQRVLVALLISYLIVMSTTVAVGFWVHDARSFAVHFAMGLFATIFTCFIYCVLLTYFVIAGKMIKQAVLSAHLDEAYIQQSQRPKAKIVRLAALAVAMTLIAALLGAWANVGGDQEAHRSVFHMIAELLAIIYNLAAFGMSYQYVYRNAQLVNKVFGQIAHWEQPTAPAS